MNKIVKKLSLILVIFITVIILGTVSEVNALTLATCHYSNTGKEFSSSNITNDMFLTVTMNDKYKIVFTAGASTGDTSLFFVENNVLYCPDKFYYNESTNILSRADISTTLKYDNGVPKGVTMTLGKNDCNNGYCKTYNTLESDGKLSKCISDANVVAADLKKLKLLEKNISNATEQALKTYSENLEQFDLNKYCSEDDKEEVKNMIKQVSKAIKTAIKESKLSNKEKEEAITKTDEIVAKKLPDLPTFEPKEWSCSSLDKTLVAVIQKILLWTRILVPLLLIVLVSIDFAQAVVSQDQDAVKKAISKAIKRGISALAVFFVPFIVSVMLGWYNNEHVVSAVEMPEDMVCEEVIN